MTSPVEESSCCKYVCLLLNTTISCVSRCCFCSRRNGTIGPQKWLPSLSSSLTPNCVSLYFRRGKPKSGVRFGARTRTAFWNPFQLELRDNKVPCSGFLNQCPRKPARSEM